MLTEPETRAQLLKVLDDAQTFDALKLGLLMTRELGATSPVVAAALRFVVDGNPCDLDAELEERFAQVLSRFVESREALRLAGLLEAGRQR